MVVAKRKKKTGHGGHRLGAGRPRLMRDSRPITVRIEADEGPALQGRGAIRASLSEEFCDVLIDFTVQNMRVEGHGDLAYAWDTFTITAVVEGDTITANGNWLGVVRRQADGSWKVKIDTPSLETPWPSSET